MPVTATFRLAALRTAAMPFQLPESHFSQLARIEFQEVHEVVVRRCSPIRLGTVREACAFAGKRNETISGHRPVLAARFSPGHSVAEVNCVLADHFDGADVPKSPVW